MKKIPPKRKEPVSYLTFTGKRLDMWEHADFTNRMFPGLIDLSKAQDLHGDTVYRMKGIESYRISYARVIDLAGVTSRSVMVVQEYPSNTIWIMKPNWIRSQNALRGKVKNYAEILDKLCLGKVLGNEVTRMVQRNELLIENKQIEKK